jgi:hypothetical protein
MFRNAWPTLNSVGIGQFREALVLLGSIEQVRLAQYKAACNPTSHLTCSCIMRFFTALLVLSAASITVAHHARQCAVCPEIVEGKDSGNIYVGTPPSPDADNTTLCG